MLRISFPSHTFLSATFLAAMVATSIGLTGCSTTGQTVSANRAGLQEVGAIRLPTVSGRQQSLADFHGKIVMLHFFASWCMECAMEAPSVQSLMSNFQNSPFTVVAVAVDDDPFALQTFVARHNVRYPVLLDLEGHLRDFFQVKELPVTVFLDKTGTPIYFKDPQSGETTAKIVGPRMWDSVEPVQMIAGLVESVHQ